ncbi:MAG: HipA domain-containing protein [Cyclobacteriaceae bacterium]
MRCLYCYKKSDSDFHTACSKKIFGAPEPPQVPYTESDLLNLAEQMIKGSATVTGVQPKLSLHIEKPDNQSQKLTIVGLWGQYILKPQSHIWGELPQIEDLTMHLARLSNIRTVEHSLVKLMSGDFAYITKRMDREKDTKLHMEDMCQLAGRLTEDKYKSSYERIAKEIWAHSTNPGLDVVRFYELVLFSFLTGNADMHLKNFSLLRKLDGSHHLAPAYDLVSSELLVEDDDEELALTLNGKKKKLKYTDFQKAMETSRIPPKAALNILTKFSKLQSIWSEMVQSSFLSNDMKEVYNEMLIRKHDQLYR